VRGGHTAGGDVETLSPEQEEFVRGQALGHLATADAHGQPYVVPVCFVYLGGRLYTPLDEKPKSGRPLRRRRNIEENRSVSIVFDRYDEDWRRLAWVLVLGAASLVMEGRERGEALTALRAKYPQYRSMALEGQPLIRIDPRRVSAWGAVRG
jgi:PPOX class probable F420-dependent enzyme